MGQKVPIAPSGEVADMTSPARTVVVTGAGAGIGRALAQGFTQDGWRVAGVGRAEANLKETGALCPQGAFVPFVVDVADNAAVAEAMAEIERRMGPIDALVCNAAVYPRIHFLDQSAEDWDRALMVNVSGVANFCREALPGMLARNRGRIVIVGSQADQWPLPGASIYSVSKGALHPLTLALANEIDRNRYPDVLVNEYLPNPTRTRMSAGGDDPAASYPRVKALVDYPSGGPTGRMWRNGKEVHRNRSPAAMTRRALMRMLGRG
jgi:NAD(P)-dependent dehydrogenase (short-subunit alcohol dehydrogenase family)